MIERGILEVRNLAKRFHGCAAVSGVNFVLRPGEILGCLGPNGSGKSVTLKMIAGLLEPSHGSVVYSGVDVTGGSVEFKRRFGYVPEEPHLYQFLSGREHLELVAGLRHLPTETVRPRINALLDRFGLGHAADQSITSYSKGMKQKTLLIAALLHDPDLIILDEPESGLDVGAILVMRDLVRLLAARGKAILYSSHIVEIVERLCTRVVVLGAGRINIDGGVDDVRATAGTGSLEDAFATLVAPDHGALASQIADIVTDHV